MHRVLFERLRLHRLERARTDVQIDRRDKRPLLVNLGEQLGGEMQSGRGGGNAAIVRRVHRLISFVIGGRWLPCDVRWERHRAVLRERRARIERTNEPHAPQSAP